VFSPSQGWIVGKKVARELLSDRPTQYMTRCPLSASHVSTSQWPTWKNTHTLNIILDDYKQITSCVFFKHLDLPIYLDGHMESNDTATVTLQVRYC